MPTMGAWSLTPPSEPSKGASPYVNTPPALATSQYPWSSFVGVMATMGWARGRPPADPYAPALPKFHTLPWALANQKLVERRPVDEPVEPEGADRHFKGVTVEA